MFLLIFPKDQFKITGDKVRLSLGRGFCKKYGVRYLYFDLPATVSGKKVKEIRIIPRFKGKWFEIEHVYEERGQPYKLNRNKYLSIDLGVNNFASIVDTIGTAILIEGRHIKSVNQWYNKRRAILQSVYSKQGVKCGRKLAEILSRSSIPLKTF